MTRQIGQAAAATGIAARRIRYYERIGLLPPATRSAANYRHYGEAELGALRFVARARALGFSMEEVAQLLALWRQPARRSAEVKALALRHVAALDERIASLRAMRGQLAALAEPCPGDGAAHCPILDGLAAGE